MTNERNCANRPDMSRRTLLAVLPVSGAALSASLSPATASTPDEAQETEFHQLFRQWMTMREEAFAVDLPDKELDEILAPFYAFEDEILARPATCATDLIIKCLVDTCFGTLEQRKSVTAEMVSFLGLAADPRAAA